jgi:hypothetical protein
MATNHSTSVSNSVDMNTRTISLFVILLISVSCNKTSFWNLPKLGEMSQVLVVSNNLSEIELSSTIVTSGNASNLEVGFCYSHTNNVPTVSDFVSIVQPENESIKISLPWELNTNLYVRAYIKNSIGINYSETTEIPWNGNSSNLPVVSTQEATDVSFTNFSISGQLIANGSLPVLEKGFCYSAISNAPTVFDSFVISNSPTFNETIFNLNENTPYYIRAYAKNFQGISYGNVITVNTLNYYNVGENGPAGGIVFFAKTDNTGGWHFLETTTTDLGASIWAPNNDQTFANSLDLGSGYSNTLATVTYFGNSLDYANSLALNYIQMNFDDWYLPSRDELIQMRQNLYLNGIGNFENLGTYWTSSEDVNFAQNAWVVQMNSGNSNSYSVIKSTSCKLRPIRKF